MSRKTGRIKRLQLYDRGNIACPICLTVFTRTHAFSGRTATLEHVPPKSLGGQPRCLTCRSCNAKTGRVIDQAAAQAAQERFGVTVDIMGKRDTFMLSLDGKALTPPFAGYSKQDFRKLADSESRSFTMSIKIPDAQAVAASSLKSAYLALFSLLGSRTGYDYIQGDAVTTIRQQILDPPQHKAVSKHVIRVQDGDPNHDIMLVSEPLPCWWLKVAGYFVVLPLSGDSRTSQPLKELKRLGGAKPLMVTGRAHWPFCTFGAFHTVAVHLAGADSVNSLVGLRIKGTLQNGLPLEGTCIRHRGESASLLCTHRQFNDGATMGLAGSV